MAVTDSASPLVTRTTKLLYTAFPFFLLFDEVSMASTFDWRNIPAAIWRGRSGTLRPVTRPDPVRLEDLLGIDVQKAKILQNTERFLRGEPCNHVLLWGSRGTGKSSIVKALLNEYAPRGLRVIEVDKDGKLVHQFPLKPGGTKSTRWARHTPKGTLLVCSEQPGVVTEYNRKGEVVWDYLIKTRVYGAIRLKNGNTLIASGSGKSIVEVTPEKKVVWEVRGQVPDTEIGLGWMTCLQELPNGNRIVGNCHAGDKNPQIFEITRNKKVVWEFDEWDLVGNGLACWQILNDEQSALVRKKLAKLKQ